MAYDYKKTQVSWQVGEDKEGDGVLDPVQEPKHDEAQAVENEAGWIEDARPPNW